MRLALLSLAVLLVAAPAAAQSVVVLAPNLDEGLTVTAGALAEDYARAALRAEGLTLAPRPASERCQAASCAEEARARAGTDYAAVVSLWSTAHDGVVTGATVALAADEEAAYLGWHNGGTVQGAVDRATAQALEHLRRGAGPWLSVEGSPAGARVSVDGTAVGQLPYRGRIAGGVHAVTVEAAGHDAERLRLTIQDSPDSHRHLEVNLRPAEVEAPGPRVTAPDLASPPSSAETSSALNTAAGVVLGIAAAALLTAGTLELLADGRCGAEDEFGRCTDRVRAPGGIALVVSGGAAALGAGAVFLWTPLEF